MMKLLEILFISLTVYLEAEGECLIGKQAVANVIYNRMQESNKPFHEIIFKPKQFSCWNDSEYYIRRLENINKSKYKDSIVAVRLSTHNDVTNGANHYVRVGVKRGWMASMKSKKIIGNHKFMKL